MKRVLVLYPTERNKREFSFIDSCEYELVFDEEYTEQFNKLLIGKTDGAATEYCIQKAVQNLLRKYAHSSFDGVVSCNDYPGSIVSSIFAHQAQLPGPTIPSVLSCHHKFYSRNCQKDFAPEAVPYYMLIDPNHLPHKNELQFPVFVKPVKARMSAFASKINNYNELVAFVKMLPAHDSYLQPLNDALKDYTDYRVLGQRLLAERFLEGTLVTLEGFVFEEQVYTCGIVDAVMVPNTISFDRFDYPSSLTQDVQERMSVIAKKVMLGIGFDNSLFNIEFMYNEQTDEIHIIEINPRMSSQFGDMFEKVDGFNTYQVLLDIAVGKQPELNYRKGVFGHASSCVLRSFNDKRVISTPAGSDVQAACEQFPDVRIELLADPGKQLSDYVQDGHTYRYTLINIGGKTKDDMLERFERCKALLPFLFVE